MSADDANSVLYDFDDRVSSSRDFGASSVIPVEPANYVGHLTQAWINERAAPDILPYEQACVDGLIARMEDQTEAIDELDSGNDTSMILSILYQTELERVKFVLRSYLRTRLSKIEKFSESILADSASKARLSRAEIIYAQKLDEAVFCRIMEDVGDFQLDE
ncbi:GINS complex subunit [Mortierella claussenii]|nr:GINS complex subunit [Mortierella claussenii]